MRNLSEFVYYVEIVVDKEPCKARVFKDRDQAYLWGTECANTYDEIRITEYKVMWYESVWWVPWER